MDLPPTGWSPQCPTLPQTRDIFIRQPQSGSENVQTSWFGGHLGILDFWFLYSQIAFQRWKSILQGMFKSNQRRAGQEHQGGRACCSCTLTARKTTPKERSSAPSLLQASFCPLASANRAICITESFPYGGFYEVRTGFNSMAQDTQSPSL